MEMLIPKLAKSMLERYIDDGTTEQDLPIKGINVRNNPSIEPDISGYITDLKDAYARGFNSERLLIAPIYYVDDAKAIEFVNAVNTNFLLNIVPVLFDEISGDAITKLVDKAKADGQADPLQYCKDIIDKWVPRFPNVYAWEITNEPLDGSVNAEWERPPEYYQHIRDLITYLRGLVGTTPITIGFNYQFPIAFLELVNSVDIIGMHFYPSIGTIFGNIITGVSPSWLRKCPRLVRWAIPKTQKEPSRNWMTPETNNPADNLKKILDFLATQNKQFMISEWGYAQGEGTELEEAQSLYVQDILKMMRQYRNGNTNFLGYHYYAYREISSSGRWGGIVNWERRVRMAAQYFP